MKKTICLVLSIIMILMTACQSSDYKNALKLFVNQQYEDAISAFEKLDSYKDSSDMILESKYQLAMIEYDEGRYKNAEQMLIELGDYEKAKESLTDIQSKLYEKLPEYLADGVETADFLHAYGLSDMDVSYYAYPENSDQMYSSFLYCFITGKYQFEKTANNINHFLVLSPFSDFVNAYNALFDILININTNVYYSPEDGFHISLNGGTSPLTPREISDTIIESYKVAKSIYDTIHEKGIVKDGMSDYAIAKAYANYLMKNIPSEKHPSWFTLTADNFDPDARTQSMLSDGIYNVLVNHWGECAPHAGVFDIFMNMEDITCSSVHCHINVAPAYDGHLISILYLDDKLYMCDWFNKVGILTLDEYSKGCTFPGNSLNNALIRFGYMDGLPSYGWHGMLGDEYVDWTFMKYSSGISTPNEPELPDIYWEYLKTENNYDIYAVRLADTNKFVAEDSTPFVVMYHTEHYGHNFNCTYGQLKDGIECKMSQFDIDSFAKQGEFFMAFRIRKP